MPRILILATVTLILSCPLLSNADTQAHAPDLQRIKAGGVSFYYSTRDFSGVKIEKIKKHTDLSEYGTADGTGESPEHYCFNLIDKKPLPALLHGSRYFFPSDTFICAFPLQDASVKDFNKAYSNLIYDAGNLRKLLRDRPDNLKNWSKTTKTDIPDFPDIDYGYSFISKFQYLNFHSGTGVLFLTQYEQENEPNPANNEELTLDFQGLTKDGRYYVAARLAIAHPSLPKGIDFTDGIKRDMYWHYLKREEKELDRLPEESFVPSVKSVKATLSSIQIK